MFPRLSRKFEGPKLIVYGNIKNDLGVLRPKKLGHVVVGNNYDWQLCYLSQGAFTWTLKRYLSQ